MPQTTAPRDRFDDIPSSRGRVGAHRAENPRIRGWVVFLWALVATIVLVTVGIFGTLVASGRVTLFPTPTPSATPTPTVTPVLDTTYSVLVLNATGQSGLATQTKDVIVAAGWDPTKVLASEAGQDDFPVTTVYYPYPEAQSAAAGLADAIGGARIQLSDVYQPEGQPDAAQLAVVLGLDRVPGSDTEPTG